MLKGFNDQFYFGESSTAYTIGKNALQYEFPRKVFNYNQNIKILYIIINPLSRIVSSCKHLLKKGNMDWDVYLDYEQLWERDLYTSMYYFQLREWAKYLS